MVILRGETTTVYGEGGGEPTSNATGFFAGACPSGWSQLGVAGRYLVGTPSGGTYNSNVGTQLSNLEDRETGQHLHTYNWEHNHKVTDPGHEAHQIEGFNGAYKGWDGSETQVVSTVTPDNTGLQSSKPTIDNTALAGNTGNAGTTAGTNAPYIQLRLCTVD